MAKMAVGMEIEYFDNPRYYDVFESVKRDIYSILGVVTDGISTVSYSVSVVSCVAMLCAVTPAYTGLILAASIPVAVSEHFYTKTWQAQGTHETLMEGCGLYQFLIRRINI